MKVLGSVLLVLITQDLISTIEVKNLQKSYNPEELLSNIFGTKLTVINENGDTKAFGKATQLEDLNEPRQHNHALDEDRPIVFEDDEQNSANDIPEFPDQNKKKSRRRRRKPKKQNFPGSSGLVYQEPSEGSFGVNPYVNSGVLTPNRPYYRWPRYQKPSVASEAFVAIFEALTSIARYDDQQCVPRLLCEAAGGGNLGSGSFLQPISGIQPLLTILSAYSGISTSPLFVFGRAVFLGMTSKGNPGNCRYAYPQCPTDPEQLVYYLNNHNGGFFRFFNAPQGQQSLNQFYNQLSGSYGLYQPNAQTDQNTINNDHTNHGYGFYQSYQQKKDGHRLQNQNDGLYKPNLLNNQQTYSSTYKYDKFKFENDNEFEKRILNSPSNNLLEGDIDNDYGDTKLTFPDNNKFIVTDNTRDGRILKFPDATFNAVGSSSLNINYNDYEIQKYKRRGKSILFPDSNRYTDINKYINSHLSNINVKDYVFDHEHNFYVKKMNVNDGLKTVYVVRGNGDPNHPEIVRLKPGESVI